MVGDLRGRSGTASVRDRDVDGAFFNFTKVFLGDGRPGVALIMSLAALGRCLFIL